jgi:hypothetical protein
MLPTTTTDHDSAPRGVMMDLMADFGARLEGVSRHVDQWISSSPQNTQVTPYLEIEFASSTVASVVSRDPDIHDSLSQHTLFKTREDVMGHV